MGIVELGGVIITQAARRVEFAAQNMANMTTAGYKARQPFQNLIATGGSVLDGAAQIPAIGEAFDFEPGKLGATGRPTDLAISGAGFFVVRTEHGLLYTRAGQFLRSADNRLQTGLGGVLQAQNGDLELGPGDFSVLADGTVLQAGHTHLD